jgi:hypothetical protein
LANFRPNNSKQVLKVVLCRKKIGSRKIGKFSRKGAEKRPENIVAII